MICKLTLGWRNMFLLFFRICCRCNTRARRWWTCSARRKSTSTSSCTSSTRSSTDANADQNQSFYYYNFDFLPSYLNFRILAKCFLLFRQLNLRLNDLLKLYLFLFLFSVINWLFVTTVNLWYVLLEPHVLDKFENPWKTTKENKEFYN